MLNFTRDQRVKVTDPDSDLIGKTGTVVRLLIRDDGAWINMDETPPETHFPKGDPRHHHKTLYPDQCEAVELELSSGNKPAI